jgi:hypothetical protein
MHDTCVGFAQDSHFSRICHAQMQRAPNDVTSKFYTGPSRFERYKQFRIFPAAEEVGIRRDSEDSMILSRCFPTSASWDLKFLRPFPTNC